MKKLPKSMTTVTTFSKWLALSMFVIIPILSFFYGMYYERVTQSPLPTIFQNQTPTPTPTAAQTKPQ